MTFLINVAVTLHLMVNYRTSVIPRYDLFFRSISLVNICLLTYIVIIGIQQILGTGWNPDSHGRALPLKD